MTASERLARDTERVAARLRDCPGVEAYWIPPGEVAAFYGSVRIMIDVKHRRIDTIYGPTQADLLRHGCALRHEGHGWPERLAEEAIRILRGGEG